MDTLSEKELLQAAASFDLPALTVIYDQYSPGIYRYALRLLGDEALAEDCVAETFSRFLKSLRAGRGPQQYLQAYLYRIAHNWITDIFRRHPQGQLAEETLVDGASLPEAQAETRARQARLRRALQALTPVQRQVVSLRFVEGWQNEDVALAMQKPVGAVKALQHRALNRLRKILSQDSQEVAYENE